MPVREEIPYAHRASTTTVRFPPADQPVGGGRNPRLPRARLRVDGRGPHDDGPRRLSHRLEPGGFQRRLRKPPRVLWSALRGDWARRLAVRPGREALVRRGLRRIPLLLDRKSVV